MGLRVPGEGEGVGRDFWRRTGKKELENPIDRGFRTRYNAALMANEQSSEWSYFIHYLRNTLGTLGALANYYTTHPPDAKQTARLIEQLKRASESSQDYIAAFSELTQPIQKTPTIIAMPDWLSERVAAHKISASKTVKLELTVPPGPFSLEADQDLLWRAISALLNNAEEAMPDGGMFAVSLACDQGQAVFRFRNTGSKVSPALLPDLGKPFLTMKPGRLGLGLGWARKVASLHGGEFGGTNLADGVEFWLKIPLASGGA